MMIISLIVILGDMIWEIGTGSFNYKNALIDLWALTTCLTYIIGRNNKYEYIKVDRTIFSDNVGIMDQKNKMRVLTLLSFFGMLIFGTGLLYSPVESFYFVGKAVLTVLFAFLCVMCWLKMRKLREDRQRKNHW